MVGIGLTVGGWFAAPVITTLLSKARSILEEHHELHDDVVGMLSRVEDSFVHLNAVVTIAGRRPIANSSLTIWLQNIKGTISEAEDLLDDFEANRIRKSLQNKVSVSFINLFEKFSLVDDGINKLKTLLARLDKTASKAGSFLESIKSDSDEGIMGFLPTIQPVLYGRDEEKEKLLSIVFPNVPQTKHAEASRMQEEIMGAAGVRVVCIDGIAGVGKTSLAQVIYNHPNVKEAFDLRGWAFISHNSDFEGIVKNIIRSFAAEQEPFDSEMSLEPLQASPCSSENDLSSIIHNKRFFLVLDNIPENPSHIWKTLSSKLSGGATGSIVLVTTTSKVIAESIEDSTRTNNRVTLGPLETNKLSTILKHHAFGTNRKDSLESIGDKIASKLHGLPLLAEAIGRLLRMKLNEGHWRKVAENEWWDNYEDQTTTNPALPSVTILFEFLSDPLKNCLGYCSMFPSGYLFDRNKLVHMWMCNSMQEHEEVVYEAKNMDTQWFDVLFNRSLIQPTIWKNKYTMHEVIKEFVASLGTACYTVEDSRRPRRDLQGFNHLAIDKGDFNVSLDLSKCRHLRSVLFFGGRRTTKLDDAVDGILPQSSALRVLDLSCIETELKRAHDVISTYSHLRFLDLSFTGITMLPDSFCGLYHLQVLGMRGCQFKKLPRDLIKLVNLRYLYAEARTVSLIHRIGHLTNLQGLEEFAVSEIEGHRITELQDLNELGGHLCISNLDKVARIKEASDVKLYQKLYIQKLVLKWQPQSTISHDCMKTLFHLKPSQCLEELEIQCYMGAQFPAWIADEHHFTTLRHIKLNGCEKLEILPPLGQLYHLKILILQGLNLIEEIGDEFYGKHVRVFPSLEELKFCDMKKWKSWLGIKESQTIPRLRKIEITNCSSLVQVPLSVEDLELSDCNQIFMGNSSCLGQLENFKRLKVQNRLRTTINIPGQLFKSLEVLNIQNCIVCFQGEQEHIVNFWRFLTLDCHEVRLLASLSLKVLNIRKCEVCFQGEQKHIVEFRRFLTLGCHEVHEVREGKKRKRTSDVQPPFSSRVKQ